MEIEKTIFVSSQCYQFCFQDEGVWVAELPPFSTDVLLRLPRQQPAPKKKAMTRWEKFAAEKGMSQPSQGERWEHAVIAEYSQSG